MRAPETAIATLLGDARTRRLLTLLDENDGESRIVGGAVRDCLLGREIGDIDVATTLTPDAVSHLAGLAGLKVVPTGIAHGTVTVIIEGTRFEVTTLRRDIATDGRHALVSFGLDFEADALRRDFTINALSVGLDGRLHDHAGGVADLAAGRVRFIGDPAIRIAEDHLRILRFFRFSADYAVGMDEEGMAACSAGGDGLDRLSRERIGQEMRKLLLANRAGPILSRMHAVGLLERILAGGAHPARFDAMVEIEARNGLRPGLLRRLAALAATAEADIERLRERLRLSNGERDRLLSSLRAVDALTAVPDAVRALLYRYGPDVSLDALCLANIGSGEAPRRSALPSIAQLQAMVRPVNPFRADHFLRLGVPEGPLLGEALRLAEASWVAAGFPADGDAQLRLVERAARSVQGSRTTF